MLAIFLVSYIGISEPSVFSTTSLIPKTTHTFGLRCGLEWLTAARVRDIRLMLSWRPISAANKQRAKLPENHAKIALSGQKGF
jgi:hypothetical protein